MTEYSVEDSRMLVMKSIAFWASPTMEASNSLGFMVTSESVTLG